MKSQVHICNLAAASHLVGRARTYRAIKAAVLEAGRFSVFEATATVRDARMFDRLERDPDVETFCNPPAFPWVGIKRRVKRPCSPR